MAYVSIYGRGFDAVVRPMLSKFAERRHFASDKEDALPRVRGVLFCPSRKSKIFTRGPPLYVSNRGRASDAVSHRS